MSIRALLHVAVLAAVVGAGGASLAADPDTVLSPQEKRQVAELLGKFRRSAKAPEDRAKAADDLIAIGGPAAAQLLDTINRELQPLEARYKTDFLKQATQVYNAKVMAAGVSEIDAQRRTVLDLGKDPNLTHEAIVSKGDPAMAKLAESLIVDRESVLKDSRALQAQREALLELGRHWERASAALPDSTARPGAAAPRFDDLVAGDEALCCLCTLPATDEGSRTLVENAALEPKLSVEEARGIRDLNRIRLLLGLKALKIDTALCDAARDHSKDMVTKGFFGHDSPVPGKKTPWDRAKKFGTSANAENIAAAVTTGAAANQQWFHSPGHHKNMLGNPSRVGLGNYEKLWTLMFGG